MRWITHLGSAPSTIGIPAALWLAGGHVAAAGRTALVANAMSHLAVQILKRTVARARPCDANGVPLAEIAIPDPFSFPSGHSAAATAVAASLSFAHPWLAPVALPLAGAICLSRVRLRVHHGTDVVAGAALGLAGALAARSLLS
jgi:undecaprenyl-diphosphatase